MHQQIHIAIISDSDVAELTRILDGFASDFSLYDNTFDSRVDGTIRSFSEKPYFGFGVGARLVGQKIVLDFIPGKGDREKLEAVAESLVAKLKLQFGDRPKFVAEDQLITVESTLPITEEMRNRYGEFLRTREK